MKRVNKEGPKVLGAYSEPPRMLSANLKAQLGEGTVVDLSAPSSFSTGFAQGTLNIPASMLAGWAGWLLDYDEPVYLVGEGDQVSKRYRVLNKLGVDEVKGVFSTRRPPKSRADGPHVSKRRTRGHCQSNRSGEVQVVDVRARASGTPAISRRPSMVFSASYQTTRRESIALSRSSRSARAA